MLLNTNKLKIFINRMKKIGIDIKLAMNYPWIYIDEINGKRVVEKFKSNHGFTIAFLRVKSNPNQLKFININGIFQLIRKYVKN